ncbi:MAG: hypothetical protein K8I02_12770, partial [Candidatus Methylomirabilis sp.]|nr:hypothetical protein [Deltaproteobacteria bacterium]
MRSGKMFGAAALAAALAAAGCGSSSSGGGDVDQFGYIGTVFTVDNCAAFNLAAGNDFLFSLVSGAVQLTKPGGANCQA